LKLGLQPDKFWTAGVIRIFGQTLLHWFNRFISDLIGIKSHL